VLPVADTLGSPQFSSWREEVKHTIVNTPSEELHRFEDHSDEVLYAVFSPCGTKLATCSKDCETIIYDISEPKYPIKARLQHDKPYAVPVYAEWWPESHCSRIVITVDYWQQMMPVFEVWDLRCSYCLHRVGGTGIDRIRIDCRDTRATIVRWPAGANGLSSLAARTNGFERFVLLHHVKLSAPRGTRFIQKFCVYHMHEDCLSTENTSPTDVLVADTQFNYCHSMWDLQPEGLLRLNIMWLPSQV